jgi:hypothetical protein
MSIRFLVSFLEVSSPVTVFRILAPHFLDATSENWHECFHVSTSSLFALFYSPLRKLSQFDILIFWGKCLAIAQATKAPWQYSKRHLLISSPPNFICVEDNLISLQRGFIRKFHYQGETRALRLVFRIQCHSPRIITTTTQRTNHHLELPNQTPLYPYFPGKPQMCLPYK